MALGGIGILRDHPLLSDVKMHTGYHYSFTVKGFPHRISYYPTSGRWVIDGKRYDGGLECMFNFFTNHQPTE